MNILIVVDKKNSAIDRLSQPIKELNSHFNIEVLDFHPKRPGIDQLDKFHKLWDWADFVHIAYWKSGDKIKELYPEMFESKKKILCHYNPYDVVKEGRNWSDEYLKVIVGNETIHNEIPYAKLIPYAIDLDFYKYNEEYTKDKTVCMVVARIEGKKGVREVARACSKLGYKFILVGRVSDAKYMAQIRTENPDIIFKEDISDEELRDIYYESAVHVCNSVDNFESGTLPILESMACGVPVLTRNVGHVPDIYDGGNMVIRYGEQSDQDDLEKELKDLMENEALRLKMRDRGWQTVKNRPLGKMARQFSQVYYDVVKGTEPLVSVIMPTFDRPEVLTEAVTYVARQKYPYLELVIVDSGNINVEPLVEKFREKTNLPIKYIRFPNKGEYTLAKARNLGVLEAEGEFLCFCDERIGMDPDAISEFVKYQSYKVWLFGVKDDAEKGFVENFSFVHRHSLIIHGMFNERIDVYGGQSQEIRTRYNKHSFLFQRIDAAKARSLSKSGSRFRKREDIIKAKLLLWKLYG